MTIHIVDFARMASDRTAAAAHSLEVRIEQMTARALRSLRLPTDPGPLARAKAVQADRAPCYVECIRIVGLVWQEMYDEHPGLGSYSQDAVQDHEVPPYCTVAKAMELALPLLEEALTSSSCESDPGDFAPSGVWLMDAFGRVLQCCRADTPPLCWVEEFPAEDAWAELERQARLLESEASEESRWDNFESARRLREKASGLRRKLEMAQLKHRHGH